MSPCNTKEDSSSAAANDLGFTESIYKEFGSFGHHSNNGSTASPNHNFNITERYIENLTID